MLLLLSTLSAYNTTIKSSTIQIYSMFNNINVHTLRKFTIYVCTTNVFIKLNNTRLTNIR